MKLTMRSAAQLTLPAGKVDAVFWDSEVRGFGLRLREGGDKSWVYRYRVGRVQRSIKLGNANSVSLVVARKNASQLEAEIRLGKDPAAQKAVAKREAEHTFALVAERFLDARRPEVRPSTIVEYERHLRRDCKSLHRLPITAVTQADIAKLLRATPGSATANRLRATLSVMFVWLLKEGFTLPHGNPAAYTHKRVETARDRVLSDAELRLVWNAIGDDDFGRVLKLLTLTGQRASEIAELKWGEVVDGSIVLPPERTKNHHPHSVPLSDVAKQILPSTGHNSRVHVFGRDDTGFSGFSKAKERLDEKLGDAVAPWRIHDLRRTAASGMQRLGVRVEVIERALNHRSGAYRGVAGVYQRDPMTADVQDAMNKWGRHVMTLVEGRKAVVVPMRRA